MMKDPEMYPFGVLQKIYTTVTMEDIRKVNGSECLNCGKKANGQSYYCSAACNKRFLYRKRMGVSWHT